jgi:Anti-sigma factor NepR
MKELKSQGDTPNSPGGGSPRDKRPGGLNAEIQARIGHQLRAIYDDVVRQGVPDRFADLIRKLDDPNAAKLMKPEGSD